MIVHMPQKTINHLQLKIEQIQLSKSTNLTFLASKLDWSYKQNFLQNIKTMSILNKLKHVLPKQAQLHIYNLLILSHLHFGILAWGYQSDRIFKLQNKVIHSIYISKYNAHTEPLIKSLNLLKVSDILQLQLLKCYYKYKNRMLPYYLAQLTFITHPNIHDHSTRNQNQLRTNKTQHEHARYCVRHQIPKVINSAPIYILTKINTHSLQGFSIYIKITIIQSYQEICTIQNCYICSRP